MEKFDYESGISIHHKPTGKTYHWWGGHGVHVCEEHDYNNEIDMFNFGDFAKNAEEITPSEALQAIYDYINSQEKD